VATARDCAVAKAWNMVVGGFPKLEVCLGSSLNARSLQGHEIP
jgi:hypothetical protein